MAFNRNKSRWEKRKNGLLVLAVSKIISTFAMFMDNDILLQLNDSQREAVTYCDGPQLVIAGAGSGKTRVLTYKIAYLLQQGMAPWNILALTFTNKAAREMKERIGRLVGNESARRLNMGTFHSIFARILRNEAERLGYNSNFTIYDQSDAHSLVKAIVREMGLDDKVYKASSVAERISMAKNHLLLPQAYASSVETVQADCERKMPAVKDIYLRYTERCRQANAMDFDDLLVNTWMLFENHEDISRKYIERFAYVLVDEYQDTNYVQQAIVLQLTKKRQRICVVGDDAQSIYSFRGANIDNILNFNKLYDSYRLFKLERNYRSTQLIVQAANSLIRHNQNQIPKDVYSKNESGEKILLKKTYSDKEEALVVCNEIQRLKRQEHCEYSDFAILYRTNSQSRSFEEYMRKQNIPYRIYGGLSFYQRKEIKDVIAYFRVVSNPDDEEALKRIINYPARGIGDTTVGKIVHAATTYGVSLWQAICQPMLFNLDINKGTATKIEAFKQLIEGWRERRDKEDAYVLGHSIVMSSGISRDIYSSKEPEYLSRQENLEEFLGGIQDFVESRREEDMGDEVYLSDFLQEVALLTDLDSDDDEMQPKVALMTVHSAKGLEFPTVFVVGLEENIFPSPMSNSMRELEEERRLLYVAITRAEKHCILTCAENRYRYGRMEFNPPSRFLSDIDPSMMCIVSERGGVGERQPYGLRHASWMQNPRPVATQFRADPMPRIVSPRQEEVNRVPHELKQGVQASGGRSLKPVSQTMSQQADTTVGNSGLCEGNIIEHQRFGVGIVIKVEGSGENQKATVEFKNAGTKQLLLKFARFTIVT